MKILLVEDHPLYRKALSSEVESSMPEVEVCQCEDIKQALSALKEHFDLVVLDLNLPDGNGIKSLLLIQSMAKNVPILVISADDSNKTIESALQVGAKGYIPKSADSQTIKEAIARVVRGDTYKPEGLINRDDNGQAETALNSIQLTQRQAQVLVWMAKGISNKEIGAELNIAETTVRVHVTDILKKLSAHNRTEAVLIAQKLGLVD